MQVRRRVVVLAGKRLCPRPIVADVLEKMLPVELESADIGVHGARPTARSSWNSPRMAEATPMLRLSESESDTRPAGACCPRSTGFRRSPAPSPAAEVLVVDPDTAKGDAHGKMPVIAMQQYGMGQVLTSAPTTSARCDTMPATSTTPRCGARWSSGWRCRTCWGRRSAPNRPPTPRRMRRASGHGLRPPLHRGFRADDRAAGEGEPHAKGSGGPRRDDALGRSPASPACTTAS